MLELLQLHIAPREAGRLFMESYNECACVFVEREFDESATESTVEWLFQLKCTAL